MQTTPNFPLKKAFLYTLVGWVGLSAILGIITILSGRFGEMQIRILLTTTVIGVSSMCGLSCGAYLASKRGRILPSVGIVLTLAAAVMISVIIWSEERGETFMKLAASLAVFSVACAHLCLLSLARLAEWFKWSLVTAYVIILGVAGLIVFMIFGEPRGDGIFRLLAIAAIFDAAITLLIPIFHRLSKDEVAEETLQANPQALQEIESEMTRLRERLLELEQRKRMLQG